MRFLFVTVLLMLSLAAARSQPVARQRASRLGLGMNLSYAENYWTGNIASHYSNFINLSEVPVRKQRLTDVAGAGFKTVRIPVCFGAWASIDAPFRWDAPQYLAVPDSLVRWALASNLTVIIDLHHVDFGGSIKGADSTARVVWLWEQIAERYKNTDPERVLFELRNEPYGVTAAAWRLQAAKLIQTVRRIAPNHTLIVGFHDWNGRDAMLQSEPFADPNIIYTFHFYDPFVFTHQGATWAGAGLSELKNIPFPANAATKISVPPVVKGTWIEGAITNYASEATYDRIYSSLQAAKNWSETKNVPIFLGEFGSYSANAEPDSRCRHAEAIYVALGKLGIPSAWWEWDSGFSMFGKGTNQLMPCMKDALNAFATGQLKVLGTEPAQGGALQLYPNPARETVHVVSNGRTPALVRITDAAGKLISLSSLTNDELSVAALGAGQYVLTIYDKAGVLLGSARLMKP